jgi:hypothetical protein
MLRGQLVEKHQLAAFLWLLIWVQSSLGQGQAQGQAQQVVLVLVVVTVLV